SAFALLINIRLDGETLTRFVPVLQVLAHFNDRKRHFMTQAGGVNSQIPVVEFGMAATLFKNFHVRETYADGINTYQQLIIVRFWDGKRLWFASVPQVFKAGAVEIPGP